MILHVHILNTFRAYARCRFYVELFVMILTRSGGVINFTHSADQTMVIDIHIAHYGCVTISKNCHLLCSVM
jgi:tetrahydrodipicolinate N-succinyltransferase